MPVVTVGWDKRPQEDASKPRLTRCIILDRTPVQVAYFVRCAVRWLGQHPDQTTKEHILLLYA